MALAWFDPLERRVDSSESMEVRAKFAATDPMDSMASTVASLGLNNFVCKPAGRVKKHRGSDIALWICRAVEVHG